ncbi:MAG TPA: hypothetical protein VJI46_00620 [Candidatus Nanoarchaeia archaeon]|nr:hypothetical protein [Candidatus Nanoarchaeia archaeon]
MVAIPKAIRCPLCDFELDEEDVANNYCPECGCTIEKEAEI